MYARRKVLDVWLRWRLRDLLPEPTSRHLRDPQHLATSLETATRAPCNLGSRPDVGRVPATKGAHRSSPLWIQTPLTFVMLNALFVMLFDELAACGVSVTQRLAMSYKHTGERRRSSSRPDAG